MKTYFELLKLVKRSFKNKGFSSLSIADHVLRYLSFMVTPFFLMGKISADAASYLNAAVSLVAVVVICGGRPAHLAAGIGIYMAAKIIDRIDGNIARVTATATFYGKFIDGFIDIAIAQAAFRTALAYYAFANAFPAWIVWTGIACAVLTPCHHFMYDRYSAYARWINEEKGTRIKPYIRGEMPPLVVNALDDLQYIAIFAALLFPLPGFAAYFGVCIAEQIYTVAVFLKAVHKNMRVKKVSPKLSEKFRHSDLEKILS